jgi:predicted NUDIX family NTP pyrophosphohydrolase
VSPKKSAGLLLYRGVPPALEVLLGHPGGPLWVKRDAGIWSIPKGEFLDGEDPLKAARREFEEETGFAVAGPFEPLTPVRQRSGKLVHAWMVAGDIDASRAHSNAFEMEWPPGSGHTRAFPEVDRVEWFTIAVARQKIVPSQEPLLDELERALATRA